MHIEPTVRRMTDEERVSFLSDVIDDLPNAQLHEMPLYIASAGDVVGYGMTEEDARADIEIG